MSFGFRVSGSGFRDPGFGFRVSRLGFQGSGDALLDDLLDRVALEHHRNRLKSVSEVKIHRNVQRFRGGLVFKAHRLCVSLNSRLGSNKEEAEQLWHGIAKSGPHSVLLFFFITLKPRVE